MTTEYTDHFRLNLPDFRMGPWHDLVNEDFVMIDGLLMSLYQGVDTQTWTNNTAYNPGTTAIDPDDNTFWVCVVGHTSAATGTFAADRAANPSYWNRVVVGIAPRGEWANSTHYLPNDMVSDSSEHVIAVCKTEHVSNASGTIRDDAAYWTFIADIGSVSAIASQVAYDNTAGHTTQTDLQATTDELYTQNASQQTAIDANTSAVANHGPRITTLEGTVATHTTQIANNASNITTLSTRTSNLETSDTSQNTRLTSLETASATHITDAPADGTTYARQNHAWIDVLSVAGASVLVSDTPPVGARDSSLWWESDTGQLFIKYNDGDSSQWVVAVPQLDAGSFVAKSGDTMTGDLTISKASPSISLNKSVSGTNAQLIGYTNNLARWSVQLGESTAESGGNAGSNFGISRYSDAGAYVDTPLTINRANGNASFAQGLTVGTNIVVSTGSLTINSGNLTVGGDISASRSANVGYLILGSNGTHYLGFDGTNYQLVNAGLVVGGASNAAGTVTSNNGRVLSADAAAGAQPSVTCYSVNRAFAVGMYLSTANALGFGNMGGDGSPTGPLWGYMTNDGTWHMNGNYATSSSTGLIVSGYGGTNPYIVQMASGNPNWGTLNFQGLHYPGVWAGFNFDVNGAVSFSLRSDASAVKSGGATTWVISSDARIKDVTGEYTSGLDAIAALRPVRFTYRGNNTYAPPSHFSDSTVDKPEGFEEIEKTEPTVPYANSPNAGVAKDAIEYIGLIAQEAEITMPEVIIKEKGYIDGNEVDDLRSAEYTPLIFALVNAIKELKARVEELEAKLV